MSRLKDLRVGKKGRDSLVELLRNDGFERKGVRSETEGAEVEVSSFFSAVGQFGVGLTPLRRTMLGTALPSRFLRMAQVMGLAPTVLL